jgi:PAS domain S-box-containing protein
MEKNEGIPKTAYADEQGQSLRQRAEKMAREKETRSSCGWRAFSQVEMQRNLHELLVHQIELEMQNDELRRAQAELEEARARYLDLYDLAPVGYCTLSEDGLILEANLTAAGMLGVPRGVLAGQPITRFIHKEAQDAYYLYKLQLLDAFEPQPFELRMMKSDGTMFWARLDTNAMQERGGELKFRVILSDITDRKNMETELIRTAEELERKDKLVTDFFINISHELKTPVTLIMLALEIIENYLRQPEPNHTGMIKRIATMKQNANRLSRLVGNILDITKIDAGFMEPKLSRIDIVHLIRGLVESMEGFAQKRGLHIKFTSSAKSKPFPTDSQIIERIILNLVSNAIKHTPEGGHIDISFTDMGDRIVLSVKDTGEGIPDEKKSIVFDRFRQVNTSLTRSNEGSGIGLSLIKALIELLGGRIWFESAVGVGSEFFVELPVMQMGERHRMVEQGGLSIDRRIEMEFSDIDFE